MKIGEEARVPLADFSLEGAARAELRQAHRRAQRDGASFEVVPPERVEALLPALQAHLGRVALRSKATGEKRFSVGSFSRAVPAAVSARAWCAREGTPVGFANLWTTGTQGRAVGGSDALRPGRAARRHGLPVHRADAVGPRAGLPLVQSRHGAAVGAGSHPLAPAWHRVGNFIFRHGEHFYNFEGLRRYKAKFDPAWEPRYLVARGGIALPRVLMDVSVLIAGGMKELFAR